MAINEFPAPKGKTSYVQYNRSDSLGSLWTTMGLDFQDDLDTLRVAPRLMISTDTATQAGLGLPVAFQYFDNTLFAIAGSHIWVNTSSANTGFVQDTSTGTPTDFIIGSDMTLFNTIGVGGQLWATTASGLYSKASTGGGSGAWTLRYNTNWSLQGGCDGLVLYFPVFNRLYFQPFIGTITSVDATSSHVVATSAYQLILPPLTAASCMVANSNYIWIGISANSQYQGSVAQIYQWDGISTVPTRIYNLTSRYILAMCVYEDIPYALDGNGILLKFNGTAFDEIGRLPFVPQQPQVANEYAGSPAPQIGLVQRNGMMPTRNGTIEIVAKNWNADNVTSYENIPAGIWEWSSQFGFTQKNVFTYLLNGSSSITDYGQNRIHDSGAIYDVSGIAPTITGRNGNTLAGATYYTDASNITAGIFFDDSNDLVQKKGYFVTTWFFSQQIQSKWIRLWAVFKRLQGITDSIVFKYRIYEELPLVANITWVNTTSFTTTTDVTAYAPGAPGFSSTLGGEVEILNGTGGASCAHITSVVDNSGTYTVTLDDAIVGVTTGTATARFQKWIKLFPEVTDTVRSWQQFAIGASNTRIQIKGCLTFTGDCEFNKIALFDNPDIIVTA